MIAANCTLAATNHETKDPNQFIRDQRFMSSKGGIVIEDDVWIGANSVLLDGTHVGRGAVIGACSLVRGKVEPFTYVGGNPLRLLGQREGKQSMAERLGPAGSIE